MLNMLKLFWGIVLALSLVANLALGALNFVLQPIWRAAAVSSAVASAVAATKAQAEVAERAAVAKARSKEKAKARMRRAVVAVPVVGVGAASAFEYADYLAWQAEHPGSTANDYIDEAMALTREVSSEVLADLPEALRPDPETVTAYLEGVGRVVTAAE
ncbi:MAG: hypothetical protein AAF771_11610 [Pseudomonadota bacterium]